LPSGQLREVPPEKIGGLMPSKNPVVQQVMMVVPG
jgi:hypothetical protein